MFELITIIPASLRLFLYLASIAAAGSTFLAITLRSEPESRLGQLLKRQALVGAVFVLIVEVLRFVVMLLEFSDWLPGEALTAEMMILGTEISTGQAVILRVFAALLLFITLGMFNNIKFALIPATILLLGFLFEGHTASMELAPTYIWIAKTALILHLMVFHWWLAFLIPLRAMCEQRVPETYEIAKKFGQQAMISVPILLLAGFVLLALILNLPAKPISAWSTVIMSPYGLAFAAKLAFVSILLLIAAFNKLRFTPQLKHGNAKGYESLSNVLTIEIAVAFAVITATLTAIFIGIQF